MIESFLKLHFSCQPLKLYLLPSKLVSPSLQGMFLLMVVTYMHHGLASSARFQRTHSYSRLGFLCLVLLVEYLCNTTGRLVKNTYPQAHCSHPHIQSASDTSLRRIRVQLYPSTQKCISYQQHKQLAYMEKHVFSSVPLSQSLVQKVLVLELTGRVLLVEEF